MEKDFWNFWEGEPVSEDEFIRRLKKQWEDDEKNGKKHFLTEEEIEHKLLNMDYTKPYSNPRWWLPDTWLDNISKEERNRRVNLMYEAQKIYDKVHDTPKF